MKWYIICIQIWFKSNEIIQHNIRQANSTLLLQSCKYFGYVKIVQFGCIVRNNWFKLSFCRKVARYPEPLNSDIHLKSQGNLRLVSYRNSNYSRGPFKVFRLFHRKFMVRLPLLKWSASLRDFRACILSVFSFFFCLVLWICQHNDLRMLNIIFFFVKMRSCDG